MATQPIVDDSPDNASEQPTYTEVEQIAMDKGWKPKDQFKGDDTEWRPASDFLRHMPGKRELNREIGELKRSIEGITRAADRQVKREVKERTAEIEARFARAVEDKDTAGAAAAAKDMRELEREQAADVPDMAAYERRFQSDNPWYGKDAEATDYAIVTAGRLAREGKSPEDQLEAAAKAVRKRFPELFDDGNDEPPAAKPRTLTLNNPGRSFGRGSGTAYGDMPDAAKRAADRTYEQMKVRNGDKVPDRKAFDAQYAKDFFAE